MLAKYTSQLPHANAALQSARVTQVWNGVTSTHPRWLATTVQVPL
jgi:hypothetical protein